MRHHLQRSLPRCERLTTYCAKLLLVQTEAHANTLHGDICKQKAIARAALQVRAHIAGRCIIGHGLGKDLAALGVEHPR